MKVRLGCRRCEATVSSSDLALPAEIGCPVCGERAPIAAPPLPDGPLESCLVCGGPHMFLQKEFPRRLGMAIVIVGAGLFLVLMGLERIYLGFGALGAVAALDLAIYRAAPLMTVCYHCQTEFRGAPVNPHHSGYDPKIGFYAARRADKDRAAPGP